jgi:hypothetical protein
MKSNLERKDKAQPVFLTLKITNENVFENAIYLEGWRRDYLSHSSIRNRLVLKYTDIMDQYVSK